MKKKALAVLAVLASAFIALGGCSPAEKGGGSSTGTDPDTKLELKVPDPPAGEMPKILFVGNSHTFSNDLPGVFYQMTAALSRESDVYSLTEGYYKLQGFADPEDELGEVLDKALSTEHWDFVVLQENTGMAVSPSANKDMFPYARTLDEKIRGAGGQTAFLMTWAPKNGLESGAFKMSRDEVQSMLSKNYTAIATELDSLLIPAGTAFMRCTGEHPEIELWDEDEQHPSPEGTYLAACTAYAVLFRQSPEGCAYTAELDANVAAKLQSLAAKLVLDE